MLFYSFKNYLKDKFPGLKVYKIALDAGFTCPHRSADTRVGGCIYCENRSFSPYARLSPRPPISEQIKHSMEFYRRRHKADKFIIYFQAYTNTFMPVDPVRSPFPNGFGNGGRLGRPTSNGVDKLKALYDEALSYPDIVGLAIGTRPDCVPDKTLDLITEYTKRYDVWLEYGLQSANDKTLEFINRGHKFSDFEDAVKRTKGRGISIAAHLILGLPNETRDDMLQSVQKVIDLGVEGIKLHHLYIARNTQLAKMHKEEPIKLLTLEEYIPLVCDIIEILPPKMVMIRTTGELSGDYLIAPQWGISKSAIIRMIEEELTKRGSHQGSRGRRAKGYQDTSKSVGRPTDTLIP